MRTLCRLLLTLCCIEILGAAECDNLPLAPPQGSDIPETVHARSFQLSAAPGGPIFRITIRQTAPNLGVIEVAPCAGGPLLQSLPIATDQTINFIRTFHAQDINFDGYLDLAVLAEFGGKWGSQQWWIYDPSSGRFAENALTRQLRELKANEYILNAARHEIQTRYLTEPWGCGSTGDAYRVAAGSLLLVQQETPKGAEGRCDVIVSDRAGGVMRVTTVRRFVDGKPVN